MHSTLKTEVVSNGIRKHRLRFSPEVRRVNKETADVIASRQRELVPVLTGNLRDTIEVRETAQDSFEVIEGGPTAHYAGYVEYGTERQAAQPHARPAAQFGLKYQRTEYRRLKF
jgi:HK97 gp10 family phage protein